MLPTKDSRSRHRQSNPIVHRASFLVCLLHLVILRCLPLRQHGSGAFPIQSRRRRRECSTEWKYVYTISICTTTTTTHDVMINTSPFVVVSGLEKLASVLQGTSDSKPKAATEEKSKKAMEDEDDEEQGKRADGHDEMDTS